MRRCKRPRHRDDEPGHHDCTGVRRAGLAWGKGDFQQAMAALRMNFSVLPPGVGPGVVAWWVPALVLGALQGVANHAVPRQAVVGAERPGPPQFYHIDTDAQRSDGDSARQPQAGRVPDPPLFCQSRSRQG
jgi:hypothetical protein